MGSGYLAHGFEGSAVRRSCALPLTWGLASDALLGRVLATATSLADRRRMLRLGDEARLRAAGLVLLTLQTGRTVGKLGMLPVHRADSLADGVAQPGALFTGKAAYLVVPPLGRPAQAPGQAGDHRPVSPNVVLPLAAPLRRVIERLVLSSAERNICFLGNGGDREVHDLLRSDGDWRAETTKAERSLTAAQRWLRHRLRVIEGGDPALSAMLDPDLLGAERTLSSYATIAADRFWVLYRSAIAPLDATLPVRAPAALTGRSYGNPRCPDDTALRSTATRLFRHAAWIPCAHPRSPARAQPTPFRHDHHLAVMMRCHVAATFGTGQRGTGRLARLEDVDPESGFAWVIEKSNPERGYGGARGVFHPLMVRRHLAAYEDYLDDLARTFGQSSLPMAKALAALRADPGITFFKVTEDNRLLRLTQGELCRAARRIGWTHMPNAGRRWLRSALIGQVPSDALAAQFGHHLDGLDVWNEHSGLSPQKVAAALEPAIHRAMATVGMDEPPATTRPHPPAFVNPAEAPARDNQRFRVGRILASAIWNGAMLDQRQEATLIQQLGEAVARATLPTWIEFDLRERFDQQRWHIDDSTRALLVSYREQGLPPLKGVAERLLAEFLGSAGAVSLFREAAVARWRWRLPPVLLAKAQGKLANHSLRSELFTPGRRWLISSYGDRPRTQRRETCIEFIRFIKSHWYGDRQLTSQDKRCVAGRSTRQRKQDTHHAMRAELDRQPFHRRMTPLERSLARGLIDGLVVDRGKQNARGYAVYTQIRRAWRLWRLFVPLTSEAWEADPVDQLTIETLTTAMFPRAPWRNDVAADLSAILRALPETPRGLAAMAHLATREEQYTADLIHPDEYDSLRRDTTRDDPWIMPALTLCYRTGLRYAELGDVDISRVRKDEHGPASLTLDRRGDRRLKTFWSRRHIPLNLLLGDGERRILADFFERRGSTPFPKHVRTDHPQIDARLNRATRIPVGIYPFRHAFATNALAALLWPEVEDEDLTPFFDPFLLSRRQALRDRLCGGRSLGAIAPHALACVMGHTSPHRTLFSYAHNLEVMLAAHVRANARLAIVSARLTPGVRRTRRTRRDRTSELIGEPCQTRSAA